MVNSGTVQGDIQGPPVYNFCLNLQCESSRVEENHILDTDYADDMALLDSSEEG